jgi:chitinase
MVKYADWMNLMTYDLHGSWDSPEDQIGSVVLAHTNLTEISSALNLLWRNNVPANKVNLGIGFYGRSYTLSDPSCSSPGCGFKDPGVAGGKCPKSLFFPPFLRGLYFLFVCLENAEFHNTECTGTPGILSYDEIEQVLNTYQLTTVYDNDAGVNYFSWSHNQWVVRTKIPSNSYKNQDPQ